jgi:ubiquinone/menaquinone biosynthesis C-methylase UbiE
MKSVIDTKLDNWAIGLLADPITKKPKKFENFKVINGIIDARILLENSYGFSNWFMGQEVYEHWEASGIGYKNEIKKYEDEIIYDKPIYENFKLNGTILDIGGGTGTVREFLPNDVNFISIDPFLNIQFNIPASKIASYSCLSRKLNFISALAEFLPFQENSFDWVHMRSMLDHVQVPDLALIEAHRVLKNDGKLLVGMFVDGGKDGNFTFKDFKRLIKEYVGRLFRYNKWVDHHTWHPTFKNLQKLIESNNFIIEEIYWQPYWNNTVVYIQAKKLINN